MWEHGLEQWIVLAREVLQQADIGRLAEGNAGSLLQSLRLNYLDLRHQAKQYSRRSPYLPRTIPFRSDPFWPTGQGVVPEWGTVVDSCGWEGRPFEHKLIEGERIDFGNEPWGEGACEWLTTLDPLEGATASTQNGARLACAVKVFRFQNALVGFGSLQETTWQVGTERLRLAVIPWMAVDRRFWGIAYPGEPNVRFSDLILDELTDYGARHAMPVGLYVADQNLRAKSLYARHGFRPMGPPRFDRNGASFRERWVWLPRVSSAHGLCSNDLPSVPHATPSD
jgi:hypothetical protein